MCTYIIQHFSWHFRSELIGIYRKNWFKFQYKHLILLAYAHRHRRVFCVARTPQRRRGLSGYITVIGPKRGVEHPWLWRLQVEIFLALCKLRFEVGFLTFCPNILPYKLVCNANTWPTFSSASILEVSNRISTTILVVFLRQFTDYCPGTRSLIF